MLPILFPSVLRQASSRPNPRVLFHATPNTLEAIADAFLAAAPQTPPTAFPPVLRTFTPTLLPSAATAILHALATLYSAPQPKASDKRTYASRRAVSERNAIRIRYTPQPVRIRQAAAALLAGIPSPVSLRAFPTNVRPTRSQGWLENRQARADLQRAAREAMARFPETF